MAETATGRRPEHQLGRKRDDERTQAILDVAAQLISELGFDRFRVQDVAERAGTGTSAIYRRWATKEALAADAIRAMADPVVPHTDDPRADLRTLLVHKLALAERNPDLLPGAVTAIRGDAGIAAAFAERYTIEPYRQAIARILGDDHPRLSTLAELGMALALHRNSFGTPPLDAGQLADEIVALVDDLAAAPAAPRAKGP